MHGHPRPALRRRLFHESPGLHGPFRVRHVRNDRGQGTSTLVEYSPAGCYLDTSALDAFLLKPDAFGPGPFVLSEYSLAEKARLPWDEYCNFVHRAEAIGLRFLRVPPVTQILTGNLSPEWHGSIELVTLDVRGALDGRALAVRRLNEICEALEAQFQKRYAELRPHYAAWLERIEAGENDLIDPRSLKSRRELVVATALESLGLSSVPAREDSVALRLRWAMRTWEMAMVFVRMDRKKDRPRDLRNDPIDAVHHALASTFCRAFATGDGGLKRIREIVPPADCSLIWIQHRAQTLRPA